MKDTIISLFELAQMFETFVDDSFGGEYFWVTAEISSLNIRRGHCYLNLIDKDPGSAFPKAEMKGIIWQNNFERINSRFSSITGFGLKQDISILCLAAVNFSPRYGLSLNIYDVKGEFTLGELALDKKQTLEQLVKNGLYDKNKQLPHPPVPQRIAALSATDSKGFEDFLNVLKDNTFGYRFFVRLFPVMLQGNRAADSIATQLKNIATGSEHYDLIILVRGGGGSIDLHCFNSYTLAEAIALSPLPVITGIGHTTDYTVADEVAAIHKETPTAVAHFIIQSCKAYEDRLNDSAEKLSRLVIRLLDTENMNLEKSAGIIRFKPQSMLNNEKLLLNKAGNMLFTKSTGLLTSELASTETALRLMKSGVQRLCKTENDKLTNQLQLIKAQDPLLLLKKGYSITRFEGKSLKGTSHLKAGDELETITAAGSVKSVVKDIP
jgi:exodeoxyribonuclease VII large subunit